MALNLMGRDLAIDLGTANTLVFMRGKGIVLREPSVVAVRNGTRREVLAVGEDARDMIGRTPGNIVAIRPLKDGVIADYDTTELLLRYFIRKAVPRTSSLFNPRVVLCVPHGITEVERRALEEAARNAGAREAILMEEPMAAAIGAGLDVYAPCGSMIIDIGGGTAEVAVLSLGGIVTARSLRVGGSHMDEAIVDYIRREYNMMIGERTAEEIKVRIGSVYPVSEERSLEVRGRDLVNGLPCSVTVNSKEIRHALREPACAIIAAVRQTLEQTPPELSADIMQSGITVSGGTAALTGFAQLLQVETGMPVRMAPTPTDCVVIGASVVLDTLNSARRPLQRLRMESV
jgi:rod shape-determining protein MreB